MDMSMMPYLDVAVPMEDGSFISERVARIVELIREYDYRLDVEWIPPAARREGDDAFRVIEHTADGRKAVVMGIATEDEFDERVLARIYGADNKNWDVQERMEAANRAHREYQRKRREEIMEENNQMAAAILRSPKSTYKIGDKVFRDTPR
jgi:hypothetical protein